MIIDYSVWHFEGDTSWTPQINNRKEVWLAFQGNNESRSGSLKQTWAVIQVCVTPV